MHCCSIQSELLQQHDPTGSIVERPVPKNLILQGGQSANGLGLSKMCLPKMRPYHSEKQGEGRQEADATTVKRG